MKSTLGTGPFIAGMLAVAASFSPAWGQPQQPLRSSIEQAALGTFHAERDLNTGAVTFLRSEAGFALGAEARWVAQQPARAARTFLRRHQEALGMPKVAAGLWDVGSEVDDLGMTHVRFQQHHAGVPVYGMEVIVHFARDGRSVAAVNGHFLPDLDVATTPHIDAAQAVALAQSLDPQGEQWSTPELVIYTRQADPSIPHDALVWLVRIWNEAAPSRYLYVVDALSGAVLTTHNEIDTARSRQVFDANNGTSLPGTLVRSEGQGPVGDTDTDNTYDYVGDSYDYFFNSFGRDSFDDNGATMRATVHYDVNYLNAFWNGAQLVFGDGMGSDDVCAHELAHGVTEFTANLIYLNQSGALNESFSDIFGEFVDLGNGAGNDSAGVRWLLGEDLPAAIGVIRDMSNPPAYGDPDRGSTFVCTTGDNGGVHTNSGIPNKACFLMTDGGTFNGVTVTGIGITKVGLIQYRTLATYLTPSSSFLDNYNALQQACTDLVGTSGITAADCAQVLAAITAVEMDFAISCSSGPCSAQITSADATLFDPDSRTRLLQTLYRTRNLVLRDTPVGDRWIDLYYGHATDLARAFYADPLIRAHGAAFLREVTPGMQALASGSTEAGTLRLSSRAIQHLETMLDQLETAAPGSALSRAIAAERARLSPSTWVGHSYAGLWQELNRTSATPKVSRAGLPSR